MAVNQRDRLGRAEIVTSTASFTIDFAHYEIGIDGIEHAYFLALATLGAFLQVNDCFFSAVEIGTLLDLRPEDKMKVGSVHITVGRYLILPKGSQRGREGSLPCAPLTA